MRFHPVLHYSRLHAGHRLRRQLRHARCTPRPTATWSWPAGAAATATASWSTTALHRGTDLTTTYNHLTTIVRSSGHVSRGQLIGYSGTTGLSTGCHLHFETRQDGTPVNPRTWF